MVWMWFGVLILGWFGTLWHTLSPPAEFWPEAQFKHDALPGDALNERQIFNRTRPVAQSRRPHMVERVAHALQLPVFRVRPSTARVVRAVQCTPGRTGAASSGVTRSARAASTSLCSGGAYEGSPLSSGGGGGHQRYCRPARRRGRSSQGSRRPRSLCMQTRRLGRCRRC